MFCFHAFEWKCYTLIDKKCSQIVVWNNLTSWCFWLMKSMNNLTHDWHQYDFHFFMPLNGVVFIQLSKIKCLRNYIKFFYSISEMHQRFSC